MYRSDSHGQPNTIYIVGARGVGKTSLLNVILGKGYNENIRHSRIGITTSNYRLKDRDLIIKELTDDDNFSQTKILKNQLEEVILIIVVFAIDNEDSLEYAKSLVSFIENNITYNKGIQIVLFGNKYDSKTNDAKIKVNQIEADNYASDWENCTYFNFSCKTGFNMEKIEELMKEINENSTNVDKDDFETEDSGGMNNNQESNSCILF